MRSAPGLTRLGRALAAVAAVATAACCGAPAAPSSAARGSASLKISHCAGQNAEVVQAASASYVYEVWIGCGGIGFARSVDGGRSFGHPVTMPESKGVGFFPSTGQVSGLPKFGWDPAIAVGPSGTVYVSYMVYRHGFDHPVVDASFDHGATFPQVVNVAAPRRHAWGDRDYLAVAPDGTVYLTWDYGQSLTTRLANIVIQRSPDGGRTWSPFSQVTPGFPDHGGGSAGVLLAEPRGRVDVLFWVVAGGVRAPVLPGGHIYFTSSGDRGQSWSKPVAVQPGAGTIGRSVTWIDTSLSADSAGNLYATWDTQRPGSDVGWLSFSADHGRTWSAARRATPDHGKAEHIMAVIGGRPGIAYVGWLADNSPRGFAAYLRPFSVRSGWLCAPTQVSRAFGASSIWPGDTIGISVLPGHAKPVVMLSWGSAVDRKTSQIWASAVPAC